MRSMVRPGGDERRQPPVAEVKPDSWAKKQPENPPDDMVTLTKTQLRTILEAIGQVGALDINDRLNQPQVKHLGVEETNNIIANNDRSLTSDAQKNGRVSSPTQLTISQPPCPLDIMGPSSTSKSIQHWASPQSEMPTGKLSSLSKIEQKRLQWAQEKAEMQDWNPWGKSGPGVSSNKNQLVPVIPRTEQQTLMVHTNAVPYANSVPGSLPSCLPSPTNYRHPATIESGGQNFSPVKTFSNYSCITQPVKSVPPALKGLQFGPFDNDPKVELNSKRQQWLQEIDYQCEEERHHQEQMREEQRHHQEQMRLSHLPDPKWLDGTKDELESTVASADAFGVPGPSEIQEGGRSYARGQGFKLDPESAARAEERRQKAQEYQRAIRIQMEEKQRRLQEERERKKLEEEEEERRLAEERARIQEEYEQEQNRQKQKSELEERKRQAIVMAVQEAKAQAEAEKKARKIHKLVPITSDVQPPSNSPGSQKALNHSEAEDISNRHKEHKEEGSTQWTGRSEESSKGPQQTATVRPVQSGEIYKDAPPADNSNRELGIQTVTVPLTASLEYSGYTVNRVLTPSKLRIKAREGKGRDFGTQTDVNYGRWIRDDAESTESNTSSINGSVGKRFTRVQHSKPYKASRRVIGSDIEHSNARPKWGVNQPSKSYIRMTERDPHFTKRKKMQELRKQHWEREMAAQQAIMNARRSTVSYPSSRSRRILTSSDGTVGFSSSDMDTRSVNRIRSNSPPQFRNTPVFRSSHGSADDIIYLGNSPSGYQVSFPASRLRRGSQSSDNLPSIVGGSEPAPSRLHDRLYFPDSPSCSGSLPPMRRKWHSQETFFPQNNFNHSLHPSPVPAIQKRMLAVSVYSDVSSPQVQARRKWSDQESFDLENVAVHHHDSSEESSDRNDGDSSADSRRRQKQLTAHDPLVHPEVITGRPTPRQDRILQQLSTLRQGLLLKQRELESLIRRPPQYMS